MVKRIDDKTEDKKVVKYQPPRDLELYCYALVSQDVKGNKLEAERVSKVDKGKFYWAWKNHPEFRAWYMDLCFQILTNNSAIPAYALMGSVIDKDVQAIRTFYELTGQLKNKVEHSGEVKGGSPTLIVNVVSVGSDANGRRKDIPSGHRDSELVPGSPVQSSAL